MSAHTPGPWLWLGTEGTVAMIVDEDGYSIARVTVTENSAAHHALQANLRLMTAAPDLLDALRLATHCLAFHAKDGGVGMDDIAIADAYAAIERATGTY